MDGVFCAGESIAILGANGSGKSTLLQVLSGYLTPSEGSISWKNNESRVGVDDIFKHVSLATPYMTNYDEFTLKENIDFFSSFKSFRNQLNGAEVAELMGLTKVYNKPLKFYSSGMKQRVKLGLAILADTSILLLDEPSSHLDSKAITWYQELLRAHASNRIVFVASNKEEAETIGCTKQILIEAFKQPDVRA